MSTVHYKDVEVPQALAGVIQYMSDVERYHDELHNLGNQWDLLTILGQMSGTGTDMTGTREGFGRLTSELLGQLGMETLKKAVQEIGSKAQVAVDIVIRNLFERTADIGFLATDDDIRAFLRRVADIRRQLAECGAECGAESRAGSAREEAAVERLRQDLAALAGPIHERFREYVSKYSVYYDIILMNTEGEVEARLDDAVDVARTADPLLAEALETKAEYVEAYRSLDLLPGQGDCLVYAYRVTDPDAGGAPLGVLCLCFRFENEMEGVFHKLINEDDWTVLTILDREGRVIASSDPYHVPLRARMETVPNQAHKVVRFAGREYLAKTCATRGYQGYFGLGFQGHAMLPLDHAFDGGGGQALNNRVDQSVLDAVMSDPRLFSGELRSIPTQADRIQHELERTVWNGNVRESDGQSKVLLWNISDAGARTKMVFEQSIGNLHATVVGAILNDVEFQAALAVDIMDRNLYERANDCRWWALTSAFRATLARGPVSTLDAEAMGEILAYINGLYTVYTNIVLFDRDGTIVAVSNPAEAHLRGTRLSQEWVRQTLALRDSQQYVVSPFESSPLYGGRHTYVYAAGITDGRTGRNGLGGIGIVFDGEPQFKAMLLDSLPKDAAGEVPQGCFGVFADRSRMVISSTDDSLPPGSHLDLDERFFALDAGRGTARIVAWRGHYYAVGARVSDGYREYKVNDQYENDVVSLVFTPLAEVRQSVARSVRRREAGVQMAVKRGGGTDCIEVATFYIGQKWLGINAAKVVEAVNLEGVTIVPGSHPFVKGKMMYAGNAIAVVDIRGQLDMPDEPCPPQAQVVVVQAGKTRIGLVVDALGEIPEVCMSRVDATSSILDGEESYVECIIKPDPQSGSRELLVVVDPERLVQRLVEKRVRRAA